MHELLQAIETVVRSALFALAFLPLWPFGLKAMLEWHWPSVFLPTEAVD